MNLSFLLIFLWPASAVAFLDGLQQALIGAKQYVGDVAVPQILEGLKMVKRVDDFVENTIDEDCVFECPRKGFVPVPKSDHVKTANGCGSFDILFDDSESSYIHVEKDFIKCCNDHDECYDTCASDKDYCDLDFKKCLYSTCKKKKHDYLDSKACRAKAKLFYITVVGVGCQSFKDAQRNACRCILEHKGKDEL